MEEICEQIFTINVYGIPLALQIWAYDIITVLVDKLVTRQEINAFHRICLWKNKKYNKWFRFSYLDMTFFNQSGVSTRLCEVLIV